MSVEVLPVPGIPEVRPGDDLVAMLATALLAAGARPGDVVAVTQKIVSKAEGRVRKLSDVVPSARARALAKKLGKEAELVELVESLRAGAAGRSSRA